jgi:DNA-binding NtrC family response regulator
MVIAKELMSKGETVLIVEDDESVVQFASEALQMGGYKVFIARSGREAISTAKCEKGEFDLALVDVSLGDISGFEIARELAAEKPGIKIIIMSGFADKKIEAREIADKGYNFLFKPFTLDSLLTGAREMITRGQ